MSLTEVERLTNEVLILEDQLDREQDARRNAEQGAENERQRADALERQVQVMEAGIAQAGSTLADAARMSVIERTKPTKPRKPRFWFRGAPAS